MHRNTLARARLDGAGWAHPYTDPFVCYADGGDGGGSGSGSGGAGDGTGGTGSGQGGQGSGPSGSQSGQGGSGTDPWAGYQWDGKVDSLPEPVAKVIREAREDAGKARTVAKANAATEARNELLGTISKALGLEGDKPPTAEQLTQQLTESHGKLTAAEERAASATLELHVYKTANRLGADADALLDSRSFCDQIDNIDPAGKTPEEFNAAVEQAIRAALDGNPQLRAGRAPRRGGGDFAGGPGTERRPTSLNDAIAARLGG
ncbi:hypothetical protein [Streptomyces wuyuanensis]|uniref:Uncharacterized protein n=1 Tax=Streptomyces wuyuanensis TaxID=1196353 RepID=A0A1G9VYC2_9ACTN|nr:hypothetical protein [Streptomyces wuyuanensis]SDM77254.1 hypothetical protein SAMN05444921_11350 [Streptomyces wuyuanensis]